MTGLTNQSRVILHLVHRLTFGGAERVLVNYINGSQGHRHVICSFFPADSFKEEILDKNIPVINLGKKNGNDMSVPFKLVKICKQFKVDIIHCQGWGTYFEGLVCAKLLLRQVKFVFAFHGKTISDLGTLPWRRIFIQKIGSKFCDAIIAPSAEMCRDYASTIGIKPTKITLIHNGVDTELFSSHTKSCLRREFGFKNKEIIFGCVARLDPVKNFPNLIKAFDASLKDGMIAKLLIVGDGSIMPDLCSLVHSLKRENDIILVGARTDVADCLGTMDIYVQASFYEGFSMTILEAMSSGLPVIAYDVGGTHEMVDHRENGVLLPPEEEPNLLSQAMAELANDEYERKIMGNNARTTIEKSFSLAEMNRRYDQLFSEL